MRRGVIQLTKKEAKEAFRLIEASRNNNLLLQKLISAKNQQDEDVRIQMNEEDLEILLDCVGIPTDQEPDERKSLRIKSHRFLQKLREK